MKGKINLVLFGLDSYTNKTNWNFPFIHPVHPHHTIQIKEDMARSHMFDPLQYYEYNVALT